MKKTSLVSLDAHFLKPHKSRRFVCSKVFENFANLKVISRISYGSVVTVNKAWLIGILRFDFQAKCLVKRVYVNTIATSEIY